MVQGSVKTIYNLNGPPSIEDKETIPYSIIFGGRRKCLEKWLFDMNVSRKKKLLNDQGSQVDIKRLAIPEMTRKKNKERNWQKGFYSWPFSVAYSIASPRWLVSSSVAPRASKIASFLSLLSPEKRDDFPVSPVLKSRQEFFKNLRNKVLDIKILMFQRHLEQTNPNVILSMIMWPHVY